VLFHAARFPLKRIVGVELSPQLIEIFRKNSRQIAPKLKCKSFDIVCSDAKDFEVPDDVTSVFMFNPLFKEEFVSSLNKILESIDRGPRPVRVAYYTPKFEDFIASHPRCRLTTEITWSNFSLFRSRALFFEALPK